MSRTRKIVIALSAVALIFIIGAVLLFALIASAFRSSEPVIADNSILVMNVKGELPDYVPDDRFGNMLRNRSEDSVTSFVTDLRKAKTDTRVGGVLLKIDLIGAGWGKLDEMRDAIADFRQSNKPIYAQLELGTNKEYYLATACERIFLAPEGFLFTTGLNANVMFFKGSLDKLGVGVEAIKIGKYKNAPDQFTNKEMTDAHREVVNALLDDTFNRFVETIARTRAKSVEDVKILIDNSPLPPRRAKEAGLVDELFYRDQIDDAFKARLSYEKDAKLRTVAWNTYRQISPASLGLNTGERVAVIYASGAIGSGESSGAGDSSIGSDTMIRALRRAGEDKSIKAVVLRVDSPGGSSVASDVIWREIELVKAKGKPVVASMADYAASGGYYISMNADKIVAEPSTVTGSIGVFALKPSFRGFYDWVGISTESVKRGRNAGVIGADDPYTPSERAAMEANISDFYYNAFVPKVAAGRRRDPEYINSVAQGRVWSGAQARERGLVDEFGGLEKAIQIAKELAKLPADKEVTRVVLPHSKNFFDELFNQSDDAEQVRARAALIEAMPEDVQRLFKHAALFERAKRGEAMAMLPFELEIK